MAAHTTPKRRYQFTVRALVLGTTICAAALAGVWYCVEPIRREARAVERAKQAVERVKQMSRGEDDPTGSTYVWVKYEDNSTAWEKLLCRICGVGGRVTEMRILGDAPAREILPDIEAFSNLRSLDIDSELVLNEDIPRFAKLRKLSSLEVSSAELTGNNLALLSQLKNLHSLSVSSSRLTGETLAAVSACRELDYLELVFGSHRFVDARAFAHLKELPRLEVLSIMHGITDDGIREIAALPHLWWLTCYSYDVTDRGIEYFRGNGTIGQFQLWEAPDVTDKSVGVFASMPALKELTLDDTAISSAGLRSLAQSRPDITVTH